MDRFSTRVIERLRNTYQASLYDQAIIQRWHGTTDAHGQVIDSWTADPAAIHVGFDRKSNEVKVALGIEVLQYDAVLRIPHNTTLDPRDRIVITSLWGETPVAGDPLTYQIVGVPDHGSVGTLVFLKQLVPQRAL